MRARGVSPSSAAFSGVISSSAAAPSLIWLLLPAVITPSGLKAGWSAASFSSVVSRRMPSSRAEARAVGQRDGHDLAVEVAGVLRRGGELVAAQAEVVQLLARDLPLRGDHLGRDALMRRSGTSPAARAGMGGRRLAIDEPIGTRVMLSTPARDGHVADAGRNQVRGEVDRLLAGAALPIHRRRGNRDGEARLQDGVARDVERLLADLADAAHHHVFDHAPDRSSPAAPARAAPSRRARPDAHLSARRCAGRSGVRTASTITTSRIAPTCRSDSAPRVQIQQRTPIYSLYWHYMPLPAIFAALPANIRAAPTSRRPIRARILPKWTMSPGFDARLSPAPRSRPSCAVASPAAPCPRSCRGWSSPPCARHAARARGTALRRPARQTRRHPAVAAALDPSQEPRSLARLRSASSSRSSRSRSACR